MKKLLLFSFTLILATIFAGCSTDAVETGNTVKFTDSLGREVELPPDITRIAPSGAVAAMILYAAAPDKLVSIASQPDDAYKKYYSEDYLKLPSTGQIYGTSDINPEELINLNPQLIIDLGDIKGDMSAELNSLQEQTGIPVIFIEATIDTYPQAFRTLGKLLGEEKQGEALARFTEETLSLAAASRAQITDNNRYRVMFGTGKTGLDCNAKGSVQSTVLEAVGVDNAITVPKVSHKGGGNTVTIEEVMNADPDIILLDAGGPYAALNQEKYWSGLRAVQEGTYYEIPCGPFYFLAGPPSINQIIGINWLGNLLYPDLYNLDIQARIQAYYKTFWHYELSEEEVTELLKNSTLKTNR